MASTPPSGASRMRRTCPQPSNRTHHANKQTRLNVGWVESSRPTIRGVVGLKDSTHPPFSSVLGIPREPPEHRRLPGSYNAFFSRLSREILCANRVEIV